MRRLLFILAFIALFATHSPPVSPPPYFNRKAIVDIARDNTVIVRTLISEGSGVIFSRDGKSYVWTCAHVFDNTSSLVPMKDKRSGTFKSYRAYAPIVILKNTIRGERTVDGMATIATVLRIDRDQDIAVLELMDALPNSTKFYLDREIPPVGETVYHVGHYKGSFAEYSFAQGNIAYIQRDLKGYDYLDQVSLTAYSGSSGGGVFLEDGRCIGMVELVTAGGDSCAFYIPIRRMMQWAKDHGISYLLDENISSK
jgi:S1-C subfamily serine protease